MLLILLISLLEILEIERFNRVRDMPFNISHIKGNIIMTNLINPPKAKKPTKKALMQEIAGTTDLFNVASLERTNVDNLIVILDLVRGAK
jgi:hypothetical protein